MKIPEGEWILSTGTGGYALGRGDFLNERKYHSYLIAQSGGERINILPAIEEKVILAGNEIYLDSNHYPGTIYPHGHELIVKSWLRPNPAAVYKLDESAYILKEVFMGKYLDFTVVRYTNFTLGPVKLELRPKLALRNHHSLVPPGFWESTRLEILRGEKWLELCLEGTKKCGFLFFDAELINEPLIYKNVLYPMEAARGYDSSEDLYSPGKIRITLPPDAHFDLIISARFLDNPFDLAVEAEERYRKYPLPADKLELLSNKKLIIENRYDFISYRKILHLAGSDFLCCKKDVIAGYPWFTTWGRDAMISLGGVKYLEGGEDFARRVLRRYGELIREGIIPNFIPEDENSASYNTVDAPLWFVIRCGELSEGEFSKEFFKYSAKVILNYAFNKNLKFFLDHDGLIKIREGKFALTWMDAMVYGNPVISRDGKPVEIEALWINALNHFIELAKKLRGKNKKIISTDGFSTSISELQKILRKAKDSMNKFVTLRGVADRLDQNDKPIEEIRPNMVIAASLEYDVFSEEVNRKILETATVKLLTPYGLRTLDPESPAFRKKYVGNQIQRDLAYHQGSTWPYLLLFYVKLLLKVKGEKRETIERIEELIWNFRDKMMSGEYASIPELYDGDEPSIPRGAPAQAWSTFALIEIEEIIKKAAIH